MSRRKKSPLSKLFGLAAAGLTVAAVAQELAKPADERTWHGQIAYIPYDFRVPTIERLQERWWNPDDPRLLTPRVFGLGWAVNVGRIVALVSQR